MDYDETVKKLQKKLNTAKSQYRSLLERYRVLEEVRQPGTCQCSDDDACRFVRERDVWEDAYENKIQLTKIEEPYAEHASYTAGGGSYVDRLKEIIKDLDLRHMRALKQRNAWKSAAEAWLSWAEAITEGQDRSIDKPIEYMKKAQELNE